MDEGGDFTSERFLRSPCARVVFHLGGEGANLFLREKREHLEEFHDVGVLGLDEKLVETIGRGAHRIEPHGTAGGLTVFGAVALGEQRKRQAPRGHAQFFADEIGAGGDVAPLVGGTDLDFAVGRLAQVAKIKGLEQHVAEFRITDAAFALEP